MAYRSSIETDALPERLRSSVLITIDTQQDTLDGQPFEVRGTSAAARVLGRLCQAYRTLGAPIVHVVRLYLADGANAEPFRREMVSGSTPVLRPGSLGRLLAPDLYPDDPVELADDLLLSGRPQAIGAAEWIIYKPRWGAFYNTPLEPMLQDLGVATVVVGGCNFPNCPRATVFEASERDFDVIVVEGAVSGLDERAERELTGIGASVVPAARIIEALAMV